MSLKKSAAVLGAAAVFLAGCNGQEHQATAVLEGGAEVTMTVQALVGVHSDWTRRLTI